MHVPLVAFQVFLRRDGEHHTDALQPVQNSGDLAAALPGSLTPPLSDDTPFVDVIYLDLKHSPRSDDFLSGGNVGHRYQGVEWTSRTLLISSSMAAFHGPASNKPMDSGEVLGMSLISLPRSRAIRLCAKCPQVPVL